MKDDSQSQFLNWKPPSHDPRHVFQGALSAAKRFHSKQQMYKRVPDGNLAGKVLLFQMRETGGSIIEKYLETYGCPDIAHVDTENQLFDIVTSIPVQGIVFWYASDARRSLDVLHRLQANRQLHRRPTMIVYPGESALSSFHAAKVPFLYDTVTEIPYSRLEFADKIEAWFAKPNDIPDAQTALMEVRGMIRALAKGEASDLTEDVVMKTLEPMLEQPNGQFWIDVELAAYHLTVGAWKKADQKIARLEEGFGDVTLLPAILRANWRAAQGESKPACQSLIKHISKRRLTQDQMLQIGRQLSRWKSNSALKVFLDYWYKQGDFAEGYGYAAMVATYMRSIKDYQGSYEYLKHVITKAPFRWEFLIAMAENRVKMKDYRMAEHYWIVARHHPFADPITWAVGLIQSHYGQRRIRYADGLLAKMLKKHPHDPRLLRLKKIYVDERLDQPRPSPGKAEGF